MNGGRDDERLLYRTPSVQREAGTEFDLWQMLVVVASPMS